MGHVSFLFMRRSFRSSIAECAHWSVSQGRSRFKWGTETQVPRYEADSSRMPYRGEVMASLRQRGHRLGRVSLVRSRKVYVQS